MAGQAGIGTRGREFGFRSARIFPDGQEGIEQPRIEVSTTEGEWTETILLGMAEALELFGCVPREIWWDNPSCTGASVRSTSGTWPWAATTTSSRCSVAAGLPRSSGADNHSRHSGPRLAAPAWSTNINKQGGIAKTRPTSVAPMVQICSSDAATFVDVASGKRRLVKAV
jgi:hypothetical protein